MGNDNHGTPQAGALSTNRLVLDVFGRASTLFEVTMQPGDNFRVAALLDTEGAAEHLNLLQVQNEPLPYYVAADNKPVSDFVGSVSSLLTVWRKLHLEFDSMTAPPASGPEALHESVTVFSVSPNYPVAGHSGMGLTVNKVVDGLNLYEGGKLEIPGVASYRILKSTARAHINGQKSSIGIEIDTVAPTNLVGLAAKLFDDDDRFLNDGRIWPSNLRLQSPPLPAHDRSGEFIGAMQSSYAAAYIRLVDANAMGWNPVNMRTVPFKRHADLGFTGSPFDGNLQLRGTDRTGFWAYSVVLAYQDDSGEDGDPDVEEPNLGINADDDPTTTEDGYCVVFLEGIRDKVWAIYTKDSKVEPIDFTIHLAPQRQADYLNRLYGAIIHEVGHAPPQGNLFVTDHGEEGLMVKGASDPSTDGFTAKTIRRFRATQKWTP